MKIPESLTSELSFAIRCTLNSWRIWLGDDELRALCIGYSCVNPEIDISLLTDNEPYLRERNIDSFSGGISQAECVWPTADWRLSRINYPGAGVWHDGKNTLDWIADQDVESAERLTELDHEVRERLIEIVTSDGILTMLSRFRNVSLPLPIRVTEFQVGNPFDYRLCERRKS